MCQGSIINTEWTQVHKLHFFPRKPKRTRVRVLGLLSRNRNRRDEKVEDEVMEVKNMKLYMENINIIKENEKLRKQAILLHQENLVLMSHFQNTFPRH